MSKASKSRVATKNSKKRAPARKTAQRSRSVRKRAAPTEGTVSKLRKGTDRPRQSPSIQSALPGAVTAQELAVKYAPKDLSDLHLPGDFIFGLPELISQGASKIILAGPRDVGIESAAEMLHEILGHPVYNLVAENRDSVPDILDEVRVKIAAGSGFILTTPHPRAVSDDIRLASRCIWADPTDKSIADQIKWALAERARRIVEGEGVKLRYRDALEGLIEPAGLSWTRVLAVLATHISRMRTEITSEAELDEPDGWLPSANPTASAFIPGPSGYTTSTAIDPTLANETALLLDDLMARFNRHIYLGAGAAEALSLSVLHYWAFEAADSSPIIASVSPQPECGKSTLLRVISGLSPPSIMTINASSAGIYLAAESGTLILFDEAEYLLDRPNAPVDLFNAGVKRDGAVVLRGNGKTSHVWCPKVIAKIGAIQQGSLESRCIVIDMMRAPPEQAPERLQSRHDEELAALNRRCQAWVANAAPLLRQVVPTFPTGFSGRLIEKWEPLFAIAQLAGSNWANRVQIAAIGLENSRMLNVHPSEQLLIDIHEIFSSTGLPAFKSEDLARYLRRTPDRPWSDWSNPQRKLSQMLRGYHIRPKNVRTPTQGKGYTRDQFRKVFDIFIHKRSFAPALVGTDGTVYARTKEDIE